MTGNRIQEVTVPNAPANLGAHGKAPATYYNRLLLQPGHNLVGACGGTPASVEFMSTFHETLNKTHWAHCHAPLRTVFAFMPNGQISKANMLHLI